MGLASDLSARLSSNLNEGPAVDYSRLLGTNLRALFHQSQGLTLTGSNITSWTSAVGDAVLVPGSSGTAPTYQTDGSFFRGKPVVQLYSNGHYLLLTRPGLVGANSRPYMFYCYRFRSNATGYYAYTMSIQPDRQFSHVADVGGALRTSIVSSTASTATIGSAADSAQHFDRLWLDGALHNFAHDFGMQTNANTGVLTAAVDSCCLGRPEPAYNGDLSFALAGICTAVPSAQQLTALSALVARDFG